MRCPGFWPLQTNDQTGVTAYLDNVEKYVVSSTMKNPQWQRSIVLSGDVADNVGQLKGREGKDIVVTGRITLVHGLIARAWSMSIGCSSTVVSATVGLAIFGVESTSEGLALPELADAASKVDPAQRVELVRAAHAVAVATHGPSLVAMALMIGVPLLLRGIAMVLDRYPSWLGWTGVLIGGATMLAAVGVFLIPSLFPGFLLYGVLGSVIAQLWLVATGIVMLRRARVATDTATTV